MIPIIDFSGAFSPDGGSRQRVAAELARAASTVGFFYMAGHGVPAEVVDRQFELARRLFALPEAEKQAMSLRRSKCRRGYEAIGDQTLDLASLPDQKESYYCGFDYPPDHPFVVAGYDSYGSSFWPSSIPEFRDHTLAYMTLHRGLCETVMRTLALGLELNEDYFDATFVDPQITLRLLRYPPHPPAASGKLFGAGAHTDWGSVTTLAQDGLSGLEVLGPDGEWIAAPPIDGTFVVNLGDMIPRWTNGRYKSNLHRVINRNPHGRDRYSIPFFYAPRCTAWIEPVPTCIAADRPLAYTACTAGEHMAEMVRLTYGADYKRG